MGIDLGFSDKPEGHMAGGFLIGRVEQKESLDFTIAAIVGGFHNVALTDTQSWFTREPPERHM